MAGPNGAADETTAHNVPETYEVTVDGGGIHVRRSVPQDVALRVVTVLMGGPDGPPPGFGPQGDRQAHDTNSGGRMPEGTASSVDDVPESLGEFLERVEAKRNPDKITAIAYFLRKRGAQQFSRDDVKIQFERAGEPMPRNYWRDWKWTLSSRWIAPSSDDPERFYLTRLGHKAVEQRFSDEVRKPLPQSRSTRRSSTRKNDETSDENDDQT